MNITVGVLWIISIIFILVTLINILIRTIKKKRCTAAATGVITDVAEKVIRRNGVRTREYLPTVEYTIDGTKYSRKYIRAYHASTYTVGQEVEVHYNPGRPEEINRRGLSNKADLVVLVIGLVIGLVGVAMLIVKR